MHVELLFSAMALSCPMSVTGSGESSQLGFECFQSTQGCGEL